MLLLPSSCAPQALTQTTFIAAVFANESMRDWEQGLLCPALQQRSQRITFKQSHENVELT